MISSERNTDRWLAAAQTYFRRAGYWRFSQLILIVIVPTTVAFYGAFQHTAPFFIPFLGFVAAVLDSTLFNWAITSARFTAAQLIETYDASLAEKPPSRARTAACAPVEVMFEAASAHLNRKGAAESVKTWHYVRIAELRSPVADMLYIRSDVAADERDRRWYASFLLATGIVAAFVVLGVAGLMGWDVRLIVSNVLFPLVPAVTWLGRETVDQFTALNRKRSVRALVDESLYTEQLREGPDRDSLILEREALHGLKFMFRCTQPSVPWWVHKWRERRRREASHAALDDFVNDAIATGHSKTPPYDSGSQQR